ncbi:MAG: hypothetical protein MUQ26_05410, partial [Armatimonadetes bacterium]|nr:hypothetical protein [Armatimonadota bacterium]
MRARAAMLALLLSAIASFPHCSRALADTWADHPENVWVQQSPRPDAPAPGFSWEGSGAYDPYTKQWIHYGGHDGVPQGFILFTWDPATGRWQ